MVIWVHSCLWPVCVSRLHTSESEGKFYWSGRCQLRRWDTNLKSILRKYKIQAFLCEGKGKREEQEAGVWRRLLTLLTLVDVSLLRGSCRSWITSVYFLHLLGEALWLRGKQNSKGSLSLCQKVLACRLWELSRLDGDSEPSTSVTLPHVWFFFL